MQRLKRVTVVTMVVVMFTLSICNPIGDKEVLKAATTESEIPSFGETYSLIFFSNNIEWVATFKWDSKNNYVLNGIRLADTTNLPSVITYPSTCYYPIAEKQENGNWSISTKYKMSIKSLYEINNKNNLKTIIIPESITSIEKNAFKDCENLETIKFEGSNNIEIINENAFENCTKLKEVSSLISGEKLKNVGGYAFKNCSELKEIEFLSGSSITLKEGAFYNCTGIERVEFPKENGSLYVGSKSFFNCYNLKELEFFCGNSLGGQSFASCASLESVVFNNDTTFLDEGVFQNSFTLAKSASVIFKSSFTNNVSYNPTGISHFDGAGNLKNIEFHGSAKLGCLLLDECNQIEKLEFDDYVTMGYVCIARCDNLKEISFKKGLNGVSQALYGNKALEKIVFCGKKEGIYYSYGSMYENSHVKMGSEAYPLYNGCPNLKEIIFSENITNVTGKLVLQDNQTGLNLKKIVVVNPNCHLDDLVIEGANQNCTIYGYSGNSYDVNGNLTCAASIENWAKKYDVTFRDIVGALDVSYNIDKIYAEGMKLNIQEVFKVSPCYSINNIGLEPENVMLKKSGNIFTGYMVEFNGKLIDTDEVTLKKGGNAFGFLHSGKNIYIRIDAAPRAICDLQVTVKPDTLYETQKIQADMFDVKALYNDEITVEAVSSEAIQIENLSAVNENEKDTFVWDSKNEGKNVIKVTYGEVSKEVSVDISKRKISEISAAYSGFLYEGNELDHKNILVKGTCNFGDDIVISDYLIENAGQLLLNDEDLKHVKIDNETQKKYVEKSVVVSYNGMSTEMTIRIIPKEVVKLTVVYNNKEVVEGTKINPQDIELQVYYNSDETKPYHISVTEDMFMEYQIKVGQNSVKLIYGGMISDPFLVTGIERKIEDVEIQYSFADKGIIEGTRLEISGMIITELYNDGSKNTLNGTEENTKIEDYSIKVGTNEIAVVYSVKQKDGNLSSFRKLVKLEGIKTTLTEIKAIYNGTVELGKEIEVGKVILLGTYSNGIKDAEFQGTFTTEGKVLQVGKNELTVYYYDKESSTSFSCIMEVEGILPVQTNTPVPNESASPVPTSSQKPTGKPSQKPTQTTKPSKAPDNSVNIKEPKVPGNPTTVFKINSTLKKMKLVTSKKDTYRIQTNKKVIIKISAKNAKAIKYQLVSKGKKVNKKAWKQIKKNKLILNQTIKNSVLYFQYKKQDGTITTVKTNGFMVDKTAPVIVGIKNNKTYKKALKVRFKDSISGVKVAKLNGKVIKNGYQIKKKGSYILKVTDRAGNIRTIKFKVKR